MTLKNPTYGLALKLIRIEVKEKPESKFNCEFVDEEINVEHFDISTEEETTKNETSRTRSKSPHWRCNTPTGFD